MQNQQQFHQQQAGMQPFFQPQPGQVMPDPPNVVSTKDFLYLKDSMSWELTTMKKCHHFSRECSDPQLQAAFDNAGRMHQRHYQLLLKHLDPANKNNA